ncbi:unnamed protein product [Vicia faba]|uniref:Rab3GAP catalytic subunit conserved domain-containing protein n=1 Tax=Vicia faba TaxID=3906 RepID=A0AAV0ZGF7_VICFA|nr:unnamed protein product [Vicia faba]
MEPHVASSFASKARTVFHSAAAKAEQVLMDFKSDIESDKQLPDDYGRRTRPGDDSAIENESKFLNELKQIKWRPRHIGTKQDWKDKINNIRKGRNRMENTDKVGDSSMEAIPVHDENLSILHMKKDLDAKASEGFPSVESLTATAERPIPSSSVLKQLAIAVKAGRKANSMKDFIASSGGSLPSMERAGLSLSAVKALVLRDKDDKLSSEFCSHEEVLYLINSLFNPEGEFLRRKINSNPDEIDLTSFIRDIHGAPPESLVVKLAEVIGNFKTLREMKFFWCSVVAEMRKLWSEEKHLPGVPLDDIPDLKSCLLYQQIQVINCCISRKRRHIVANESLDSMMMEANSNTLESSNFCDGTSASRLLYARLSTGELVLRLGAHCPFRNVTLLETGEPAYCPITQEVPLLTEDLIKETEEFVLRTGSLGAGCSQLLSDMQAFKAANPGCILEDFVRWYSPPDWTENEVNTENSYSSDDSSSESLTTRGQLSQRMQKEGNLWHELWITSKPVPAVKQTPLFEEDLAVEGILDAFEDIQPVELFGQLFVSLLGLGFTIAEPLLCRNIVFSKLFNDCKEYVVTTCESISFSERVDELVQVYETVERMLMNPEEALKMMKHSEESTVNTGGETKGRFKKFISSGKEKLSRSFRKDQNNNEEKATPQSSSSFLRSFRKDHEEKETPQSFSSFFDSKSSLFSKMSTRGGKLSFDPAPPSFENNWIVN